MDIVLTVSAVMLTSGFLLAIALVATIPNWDPDKAWLFKRLLAAWVVLRDDQTRTVLHNATIEGGVLRTCGAVYSCRTRMVAADPKVAEALEIMDSLPTLAELQGPELLRDEYHDLLKVEVPE